MRYHRCLSLCVGILLLLLCHGFLQVGRLTPPSSARHPAHSRSVFGQPRRGQVKATATTSSLTEPPQVGAKVPSYYHTWRGHRVRYQHLGDKGPAVLLIHGFGGNCEHWRKNIPELAKKFRVYAVDLLGYGYSDKPDPKLAGPPNTLYNMENWAEQMEDFVVNVIKSDVYVACNSVGGVVGLQLAKIRPDLVLGVVLLNISLRMLHVKKQPWYIQPFVKVLQTTLRETPVGEAFFKQVAQPKGVKNILQQAYHDPDTVTDELVECILRPGLLPGAVSVFLDFISYSGGPLPEELLAEVTRPVLIGWGAKDPWEPIEMGRAYGDYKCVESFVELDGVGHCPMDEAPDKVNPLITDFIQKQETLRQARA